MFAPTFTTKRNKRGEIVGTGMGLTIVRSFVVENSGGTIIAQPSDTLDGAELVITVPRADIEKE